METITHNKIRTAERLPEHKGYYWTDTGKHFFDTDKKLFLSNFGERRDAFEWLEVSQAKNISSNAPVSLNEGNQLLSDNKVAEVAVAFAEWRDGIGISRIFTTFQQWEQFVKEEKAKATGG